MKDVCYSLVNLFLLVILLKYCIWFVVIFCKISWRLCEYEISLSNFIICIEVKLDFWFRVNGCEMKF